MELRWYQRAAVSAVYEHLATREDNPCVVMPTGSGKSPTIAQIVRDTVSEWDGRALVLAHRKELLEQNRDKVRIFAPNIEIGIYSAGLGRRDTAQPVLFGGIQSVYGRAFELGRFDLVLVDEAHRIPAEGEGMYRKFIDDALLVNPELRVIGFTATPYRMDAGVICAPENVLNHICFEAELKPLIAQGFICSLLSRSGVEAGIVDTADVHVRGGEFVQGELERRALSGGRVAAATRDILELTRERKKTLIFSTGVKHAHSVREALESSGVEAHCVTATTRKEDRARRLEDFRRGRIRYLVNVNVLTEGFDIPDIDCIVLLRPTKSAGLYVQMVGRGFRVHPEKEDCIASGQQVLTDHGLIPIEEVTRSMRLWDGDEWVSHQGVICKGKKEVITYEGLTATREHKVWTEEGWKTFGECRDKQVPIPRARTPREEVGTIGSDLIEGRIRLEKEGRRARRRKKEKIRSLSLLWLWRGIVERLRQRPQRTGRMSSLCEAPHGATLAGEKMQLCSTALSESEQQRLQRLWRKRNRISLQVSDCHGRLDLGKPRCREADGDRQGLQRRSLRARESSLFDALSKSVEHSRPPSVECKKAQIQDRSSRDKIRGRVLGESLRQRVHGKADNREVLQEVEQTERVWDIRNAGPRHRFVCEGLIVSNCLVLDYGENILRHGPIDQVRPPERRKKSPSDEPSEPMAKVCPTCRCVMEIGYASCPSCGYEFPEPEPDHATKASSMLILSHPRVRQWLDVEEISYSVHTKRDADESHPKTLRVDYRVSFYETISEWICIEHDEGSFARGKAARWWRKRQPYEGRPVRCPESAREAAEILGRGEMLETRRIEVLRKFSRRDFDEIVGYEFTLRDGGLLSELNRAQNLPKEDEPVPF